MNLRRGTLGNLKITISDYARRRARLAAVRREADPDAPPSRPSLPAARSGSVGRAGAVLGDRTLELVDCRPGVESGLLRGRTDDSAEGGEACLVCPDIDDGEPAVSVVTDVAEPVRLLDDRGPSASLRAYDRR